jgi:hypothetical protein
MIEPTIICPKCKAEIRLIMKQRAKRDEQIERVMGATVGMYVDLGESLVSRSKKLRA